MNKLNQGKAFNSGFLLGFILFLITNLISFLVYRIEVGESVARNLSSSKISIDTISYFGFPFPIFYGKSYYSLNQFNLAALVVNILAAIFFSFVVGLTFKFIWSKISSRRVKLK